MPVESYALGLLQKAAPGFLTIIRGNFFKNTVKAKRVQHFTSKAKIFDGVVLHSLFELFDSTLDFENFAIEVAAPFCNSPIFIFPLL